MKINQAGINLIKEFEGFRQFPYECAAGVWTIGYGHTHKVTENTIGMTKKQAENVLQLDLEIFEQFVRKNVKVPLTENQFSALVSLVFNTGAEPLILTLGKKLNSGDYAGAVQEFLRWNKVNGKVLNGLTRRRKAEKALFEKK
jgi:lysozyme